MKKSKRRVIAKETLDALKQGYYTNEQGKRIHIRKEQKAAVDGTILYTPDALIELIDQPLSKGKETTIYEVNGLTTLDSVRKEYTADNRLLCLNFASARNPGGGFLNGSQAQEESIARATGLYPCQLKAEPYYTTNRKYSSCLYTDHIIYSPDVPVLKLEDGTPMDEPIYTSIITAPAVNTGVVIRNEPKQVKKIEPIMERRIDMVLSVCAKHGYDTLILGAWGCGVFRNDPQVIAGMFRNLLENKYQHQFARVVFSVYAKDERFIKPFQQAFG